MTLGGVAEWFKAPVLKVRGPRPRETAGMLEKTRAKALSREAPRQARKVTIAHGQLPLKTRAGH